MPSRQKKNGTSQFHAYSDEWQKARNAKVEEARKKIWSQEGDYKPQINTSKTPANYKGPVSGYYDKINKYFGKKEVYNFIGKQKPRGIPKINDTTTDQQPQGTVEDRLLNKGEEYKSKRNQKRTELIRQEIEEGPSFKPTLISNNAAYLPDGVSRFTKVQQAQQSLAITPKPDKVVSAHEMLYYDAIVGMVQKQQKIYDIHDQDLRNHYPYICEKSRQMAGERSLQDLIVESKKVKKDKPEEDKKLQEPELQASRDMIDGFLKRNYEKAIENKKNRIQK